MGESQGQRVRRDAVPKVLNTKTLRDPRALAVDWVTRRLYVIEKDPDAPAAEIVVMTLDGRKSTTILHVSRQ